MAEEFVLTIPVENSRSDALRLIVEPWAFEVLLKPGERCEVALAGPPGHPSVEVGTGWLSLWGWEGCHTWVTKNGEIVEDCRNTPPVPPGVETFKPFFKRMPPYRQEGGD
jgi:hypothetical protein